MLPGVLPLEIGDLRPPLRPLAVRPQPLGVLAFVGGGSTEDVEEPLQQDSLGGRRLPPEAVQEGTGLLGEAPAAVFGWH